MANKLTNTIDELISDTDAKEASAPKGPFRSKVVNPNEDGNQDLKAHLKDDALQEEIVRTPGVKKYGITDQRLLTIANRSYKLQRRDPYGFWYIVSDKGGLPDKLSGVYTSPTEAQRAIEIYINSI